MMSSAPMCNIPTAGTKKRASRDASETRKGRGAGDRERRQPRKLVRVGLSFECTSCKHVNELDARLRPATAAEPSLTVSGEAGASSSTVAHTETSRGPSIVSSGAAEEKTETASPQIASPAAPGLEAKGWEWFAARPLVLEFKCAGWWVTRRGVHSSAPGLEDGKNSAVLAADSDLYVYKMALRHLALTHGWITDVDPQNLVPHAQVRDITHMVGARSGGAYDWLNGRRFELHQRDLEGGNNLLQWNVPGVPGVPSDAGAPPKGVHVTLLFARGIRKRGVDLVRAFYEVVALLARKPELYAAYAALPYFGNDAINWWRATAADYPSNVTPSEAWLAENSASRAQTEAENSLRLLSLATGPAGAISNSLAASRAPLPCATSSSSAAAPVDITTSPSRSGSAL